MQLEVITRSPEGTIKSHPLLFVHGILHGAWCWDEYFLPYFAENGYHASALSLRGHGSSESNKTITWQRINDYVEDTARAAGQIESETGKRPFIIGHSMGGLITQKYLEKYDAPGGVLLASCPPHGAILSALRVLRYRPVQFLKMNVTFKVSSLVEDIHSLRWMGFSATMPDQDVKRYKAMMCEESYLAILDMILFNLPRPNRVNTPILVIGGEKDNLFGVEEIYSTGRAYRNAPVHIVANTAHDMMLEQTWQESADLILDWLAAFTK